MGGDDPGECIYDLRRIEDVFACLEIISIARGAMFSVNPELARRMEKVSDALGAFAQIVMEGGLNAAPGTALSAEPVRPPEAAPAEGRLGMEMDVFADLTAGVGSSRKPTVSADSGGKGSSGGGVDEGIVDILTGERIK